jgi:aminoglycoside/choline kinase family phosphotransferase
MGGRVEDFAAAHGWAGAAVLPLAADASFRRYFRLKNGAKTALVMDAPPDKENVRPWLSIARHLGALGLSAPRVIAADEAAGLVLLEDLGDDTFTRLLAKGADEAALYELAVDVLIDLHRRPATQTVPAGLAPYDDTKFLDEAALLPDWFLPAIGAAPTPESRVAYLSAWRTALAAARAVPETLVLRDYHVDNLMLLPERAGVARCGLLDFQDALRGPTAYDFVSLVEDARRDIAEPLRASARRRYLAAFPTLDITAFDTACAVLGAQRHAKVIGIFTRLHRRDGKAQYLAHIPRVWRLLERALPHPALSDVRAWFDVHVPASRRTAPSA